MSEVARPSGWLRPSETVPSSFARCTRRSIVAATGTSVARPEGRRGTCRSRAPLAGGKREGQVFGCALPKHRAQAFSEHRSCEVEALAAVAPEVDQSIVLLAGFDALADDVHTQAVGQAYDSGDDRGAGGDPAEAGDELLIDLEAVDRDSA